MIAARMFQPILLLRIHITMITHHHKQRIAVPFFLFGALYEITDHRIGIISRTAVHISLGLIPKVVSSIQIVWFVVDQSVKNREECFSLLIQILKKMVSHYMIIDPPAVSFRL